MLVFDRIYDNETSLTAFDFGLCSLLKIDNTYSERTPVVLYAAENAMNAMKTISKIDKRQFCKCKY